MAAVVAGYGPGRIAAIGINASPCGGCRQWLAEFRIPRGELPPRRRHDRHVRREGSPAGDLGLPRAVKSGFIAVAGRPNVGKSTLVNALVGEKIAITSAVPNTTRRRVFGVANDEDWQLVLVDLPGLPEADGQADPADAEDGRHVLRGHRRGPLRPLRAGPGRRRRPLHRPARLRARQAGDRRRQQGRQPEAEPHHHADEGRRSARRLPRPAPGQREDEGRDRRAPLRPRLPAAGGPAVLPARVGDRPDRARSGSRS